MCTQATVSEQPSINLLKQRSDSLTHVSHISCWPFLNSSFLEWMYRELIFLLVISFPVFFRMFLGRSNKKKYPSSLVHTQFRFKSECKYERFWLEFLVDCSVVYITAWLLKSLLYSYVTDPVVIIASLGINWVVLWKHKLKIKVLRSWGSKGY